MRTKRMQQAEGNEVVGRVGLLLVERLFANSQGLELSKQGKAGQGRASRSCKRNGTDATRAGVALKSQTWESDESHRGPSSMGLRQ